MKRLTLKEVLAGYRARDEIRIRTESGILIFCGTIMRFRRKCIFGQFSKYLNYETATTNECENGIFAFRIYCSKETDNAGKDT